jgi:hypothetical protein
MDSIIERTRSALADGTVIGDGHTIFSPEHYAPHFPLTEIAPLGRTYESDGSPKGTIFRDGKAMPSVSGVYNLAFLYWLAEQVGADATDARRMMGRGFQAQSLVAAIKQAVAA